MYHVWLDCYIRATLPASHLRLSLSRYILRLRWLPHTHARDLEFTRTRETRTRMSESLPIWHGMSHTWITSQIRSITRAYRKENQDWCEL